MIALLLIAAQAAALPPADWAALPPLRYRHPAEIGADPSDFVRDEAAAGRCAAGVREASGWTLRVDLAVLAGADGQVRRIVPRAIGCPSVEQFASGLVSSLARGNVAGDAEGWRRTTVTFAWPG